MNQILTKEVVENFYNYNAPIDDKITLEKTLHGKTLKDILRFSKEEHEECHGHVQILFPNIAPSKMNPFAPVIKDFSVFDGVYRSIIVDTVFTFCKNYGFDPTYYCDGCTVDSIRIATWLRGGNHNVLRMSRIMNFLKGVNFNIEFETMRNILLHEIDALGRSKELAYTTYIWRNL